MNLIKTTPKYHRELLDLVDSKIVPKEYFDFDDLWGYFYLSFAGRGQGMASAYMTDEQLALIKKNLLKSVPEPSGKETEFLSKMVDKHGLEVVLFAIDTLANESEDSNPDVENIRFYFQESKNYIEYLTTGVMQNGS